MIEHNLPSADNGQGNQCVEKHRAEMAVCQIIRLQTVCTVYLLTVDFQAVLAHHAKVAGS